MSKPHILGCLMMRSEMMTQEQFEFWLKQEGYDKKEIAAIRQDIADQKKEKKNSYGKIY